MLRRALKASLIAISLSSLATAALAAESSKNVLKYHVPSGLKVSGDSTVPGGGDGGNGGNGNEPSQPQKTQAKLSVPATFSIGNTVYQVPYERTLTISVTGQEGSVTFTGSMVMDGVGVTVDEENSNCRGTMVPGDECDIVFVVNPEVAGAGVSSLRFSTQEGGAQSVMVAYNAVSALNFDQSAIPKAKVGEPYSFPIRQALVNTGHPDYFEGSVLRYAIASGPSDVLINAMIGILNFTPTEEHKANGVNVVIRLQLMGKYYYLPAKVIVE